MIGGKDTLIHTSSGAQGMEMALLVARRLWHKAVFEDAGSGLRYQSYEEVPLDSAREILVYRDSEAARSWDEFGATASLAGTLIHLIASNDLLTIVIDQEPEEQIQGFVKTVETALRQSIFNATAIRKAAA